MATLLNLGVRQLVLRGFKYLVMMAVVLPLLSLGNNYVLPKKGDDLVGTLSSTVVQSADDLPAMSERNDVSARDMELANPDKQVDTLFMGEKFTVPSEYILPAVERKGIVVNLPELRLYYYLPKQHRVLTFPVGIGRDKSATPLMQAKIIEKKMHPRWFPSVETRKEALAQGIVLPKFVAPGPDNPLGDYAMRLSHPEYLIHGTNDPTGVGKRSSGGCLRMYPEDIKKLFPLVPIGTPVQIVDEPYKVGLVGKKVILEAHKPLDEAANIAMTPEKLSQLNAAIVPFIKKDHAMVDWDKALAVARAETGIPETIGKCEPEDKVGISHHTPNS